MNTPRVTRSSRRTEASSVTIPLFAMGSTSSPARSPVVTRAASRIGTETVAPRRSTRRAAMDATARIITQNPSSKRRARSTRNQEVEANGATKDQAILVDDESIKEDDRKPAAIIASVPVVAAAAMVVEEVQCAICLDTPGNEVATISGCTHRFCFGCIERWSETENKCPCCKARFRTIDRVVPLPSPSPAKKRRVGRNAASPSSSSSATRRQSTESSGPVNSRTVEDRNQQSLTNLGISADFLQHILHTLGDPEGPFRGIRFGGDSEVRVGTNEGRPSIRIRGPQEGGMMGFMEMILNGIGDANGGTNASITVTRIGRRDGQNDSPARASAVRTRPSTVGGNVGNESPARASAGRTRPSTVGGNVGGEPFAAQPAGIRMRGARRVALINPRGAALTHRVSNVRRGRRLRINDEDEDSPDLAVSNPIMHAASIGRRNRNGQEGNGSGNGGSATDAIDLLDG